MNKQKIKWMHVKIWPYRQGWLAWGDVGKKTACQQQTDFERAQDGAA